MTAVPFVKQSFFGVLGNASYGKEVKDHDYKKIFIQADEVDSACP